MDTMHFDLGGRKVGMSGGSWEGGLNAAQRAIWHNQPVSQGMGDVRSFRLPEPTSATGSLPETTDRTGIYSSPSNPFLGGRGVPSPDAMATPDQTTDAGKGQSWAEPEAPVQATTVRESSGEAEPEKKDDSPPEASSSETPVKHHRISMDDIPTSSPNAKMALMSMSDKA
jgi:hypothetical protein